MIFYKNYESINLQILKIRTKERRLDHKVDHSKKESDFVKNTVSNVRLGNL